MIAVGWPDTVAIIGVAWAVAAIAVFYLYFEKTWENDDAGETVAAKDATDAKEAKDETPTPRARRVEPPPTVPAPIVPVAKRPVPKSIDEVDPD